MLFSHYCGPLQLKFVQYFLDNMWRQTKPLHFVFILTL